MKKVDKEVYRIALDAVQQIDEYLDTGRRHFRTRNGQLLVKLDQVLLAITEDNIMLEQVGIMYENNTDLPLLIAICEAKKQFLLAEHCGQAHRVPEECRISPLFDLTQVGATLHNMILISDPNIPLDRIRICTVTEKEVEYELLAA